MQRDRIHELDLLRFIAAVGVVMFHATHWPDSQTLISAVSYYGFMGVPLFFMISGFVILMTAQHRSGIEFVNSRIARLYPSFWIAVLLSSAALTFLANDPPSLAVIAANLTMQPDILFDQPSIDQVYWTLEVEAKFYALTWLVIVTRQMKRVETLLAAWLAVVTFATWVDVPHWVESVFMPMWASLFISGCYLYLIRARGANARRMTFLAASVALSIYWAIDYQSVYTHTEALAPKLTVAAITLGLAVVFLTLTLRWWSLPRSRLWLWLGCLTFPLYLTHAKAGHLVWTRLGGDEWTRMWIVLGMVLLVSGVMAALVERRLCPAFHKLLDRQSRRVFEKLGLRREDRATAMR